LGNAAGETRACRDSPARRRRTAQPMAGVDLRVAARSSGRFIGDARASKRPAGGRGRLGDGDGQRTAVQSVKPYGGAELQTFSACARAWGRSGLGRRVLGRRARGGTEATGRHAGQRWCKATRRRHACGARRRGAARRGVGQPAAASQWPTLNALNSKKLNKSAQSDE
jgi:hypothetical protein